METKSIISEFELKDIDEKKGRVLGYFSKFGNIDSDLDMIMPGAFTKSLKENYLRLKHLYQHDPTRPLSGTSKGRLIISQDKDGLFFDSTITESTWGADAIKLYRDGAIDEHSIGFQTVKKQDRKNYRELTELKLWEGSTVTWGANEMAGTTGIKSMSQTEAAEKLNTTIKAIRNGDYEHEEIFEALEIKAHRLTQYILNISQTTTPEPEKKAATLPEGIKETLTIFKKSLILQ